MGLTLEKMSSEQFTVEQPKIEAQAIVADWKLIFKIKLFTFFQGMLALDRSQGTAAIVAIQHPESSF